MIEGSWTVPESRGRRARRNQTRHPKPSARSDSHGLQVRRSNVRSAASVMCCSVMDRRGTGSASPNGSLNAVDRCVSRRPVPGDKRRQTLAGLAVRTTRCRAGGSSRSVQPCPGVFIPESRRAVRKTWCRIGLLTRLSRVRNPDGPLGPSGPDRAGRAVSDPWPSQNHGLQKAWAKPQPKR